MKAAFVVLLCTIVGTLGSTTAGKKDKNEIQKKVMDYFSENVKLQKGLNMEVEKIRGLLQSINDIVIEALIPSDSPLSVNIRYDPINGYGIPSRSYKDILGIVSSKNGKKVEVGGEKKVLADFVEHLQLQKELNMEAEKIRGLLENLEAILKELFTVPLVYHNHIVTTEPTTEPGKPRRPGQPRKPAMRPILHWQDLNWNQKFPESEGLEVEY